MEAGLGCLCRQLGPGHIVREAFLRGDVAKGGAVSSPGSRVNRSVSQLGPVALGELLGTLCADDGSLLVNLQLISGLFLCVIKDRASHVLGEPLPFDFLDTISDADLKAR